jgi:hypothetical protein
LLHHVKKDTPKPKAESNSYRYWQKSSQVLDGIILGSMESQQDIMK